MAHEEHVQSKVKKLLREESIQLWVPPYTTEDKKAGPQAMKELAERYAVQLSFDVTEVAHALEAIRAQAVKRGQGNSTYRDTGVATLELHLPQAFRQELKKNYVETKLQITTEELINKIAENYGVPYMKLILSGKQLVPGKTLEQQNVKHNSKIMVLEVNETEKKKMAVEEEKQRSQTESLKRTKKAFQILSERDGSVDPETTPFLEIADQKGNPITIPEVERRALILAMGLHEKGRALMKRKQYEAALNHLLQADEQFSKCGSQLLNSVDNYAVLQLDVAWCYRTLKSLECLTDAKQRLQTAETCFLKCYGERRERLLQIKGSTGREEVLFLRLYLLQGLVAYTEGNDQATERLLKKAEDLYGQLCLDTGKMMELMALGFTEQEARLGLRACHGNLNEAATHISQRREEKEKLRREEREKRRRRVESINTLREMGYSKKDAAKALHRTQGDLDKAFLLLLDSFQPVEAANNNRGSEDSSDLDRRDMIEQLVSLGFERGASEAALRFSGGNIQVASQLLAHHEGNLPPDILSPSPPSSLSEEPSTSSESTGYVSPGEDQMEVDLVNEVLDDIPKHEEDYLDLTLEEESEAMAQLKSYLDRGHRSQD